ncbi:MAG: hypothetical protein IPG59_09270 [Candidatus Melainabacteria bacterium]|nr:MAG: hypothetical protein IPG59_09270 [Candidatus Melainabacteria bacterium]
MNKQTTLITLLFSIIVFQPVFAKKQLDNSRKVRVKAIAEMELEPKKMRLNPNIKVGQTSKINEIKDAADWANPYITVGDGEVSVGWGKPRHQKTFKKVEEVEKFLVSLPVLAWPYGRIIALSEHSVSSLPGARDYRKYSWDLIIAAMKRLDVQVNPWPCN